MFMQTANINQRREQPGVGQSAIAKELWILLSLSLVAIVPFWSVRYPVMADYPNHLARWFVLFHMTDAHYSFASFYAPAWGLLPYISPDILAIGLQHFLPIDIVGRCILSLPIILAPLATFFLLKQACPENVGLASFSILVALNPMFLMGSISYEYSLAFCILVVGLWVTFCRLPKPSTAVGVVFGLILVYLSHLMGFVVAGIVMGVYTLFQEQRWKKVGILAILSLPALLIFARNPIRAGGGASFKYVGLTPWIKLTHLLFPIRLYTYKELDFVFLLGLAILVAVVLKKRLMMALQPAWLAASGILLFSYFAAPSDYGLAGAFMDVRILPFFFIFLLPAIPFRSVPRYLLIGLALLVLFRVATVDQLFVSQQRELKELTASFDAIPRNARVLPLVPLPNGTVMGKGYVHHLEYGVIQRGFLDPVLFHLQGVQPIRLVGSPYCPNIYCDPANASEVDWEQIANSYDYLWVRNDPKAAMFASKMGDVIFSNDGVTIYRIWHRQP